MKKSFSLLKTAFFLFTPILSSAASASKGVNCILSLSQQIEPSGSFASREDKSLLITDVLKDSIIGSGTMYTYRFSFMTQEPNATQSYPTYEVHEVTGLEHRSFAVEITRNEMTKKNYRTITTGKTPGKIVPMEFETFTIGFKDQNLKAITEKKLIEHESEVQTISYMMDLDALPSTGEETEVESRSVLINLSCYLN